MSYKNHKNPAELDCFRMCGACKRCGDKGRYAKCQSCSGRVDPELRREPHDIDDQCRCKEGVFQFRLQNGRLIQKRYSQDPFQNTVKYEPYTEDERDWDSYVNSQRERFDDPNWDPVTIQGKSTTDWVRKRRGW